MCWHRGLSNSSEIAIRLEIARTQWRYVRGLMMRALLLARWRGIYGGGDYQGLTMTSRGAGRPPLHPALAILLRWMSVFVADAERHITRFGNRMFGPGAGDYAASSRDADGLKGRGV